MPRSVLSNILAVEAYANLFGWKIIGYADKSFILHLENLQRNCKQMNIYLSTMTVQTSLVRHYKGRTQLTRKNVSLSDLRRILENPRVHTDKGYYTKN